MGTQFMAKTAVLGHVLCLFCVQNRDLFSVQRRDVFSLQRRDVFSLQRREMSSLHREEISSLRREEMSSLCREERCLLCTEKSSLLCEEKRCLLFAEKRSHPTGAEKRRSGLSWPSQRNPDRRRDSQVSAESRPARKSAGRKSLLLEGVGRGSARFWPGK